MIHILKYQKQLISFIVFSLIFLYDTQNISAQNEPFHGGRGDGADVHSSGIIDFSSVDYEGNVFTVHIDKAAGQTDTTENDIINFKLTFSSFVSDLRPESISLSGTANAQKVSISGSGTEYNVAVSGMLNNGSVIIDIPEGSVHNSVGSPNLPAVIIDNEVIYLGADLTVEITRHFGQAYLTNADTVLFDITFNETVSDFESNDIQVSGTANPQSIKLTGEDKTYLAKIYDFQTDGSVSITVPAGIAESIYGKTNESSINTENTVIIDKTRPDVEIKLAEGQSNPAYTYPIKFKVVFSEDVVDFSANSIMYGGSSNLKINVSGNGSVYIVSIDSVKSNETVSIYIAENVVHDYAGNGNTEPVYTENSVTFAGLTSVDKLNIDDFAKVYGIKGKLFIQFYELPKQYMKLEIFDIDGKKIMEKRLSGRENYIPLSPMHHYIISLSNNNYTFHKKIFIP